MFRYFRAGETGRNLRRGASVGGGQTRMFRSDPGRSGRVGSAAAPAAGRGEAAGPADASAAVGPAAADGAPARLRAWLKKVARGSVATGFAGAAGALAS
jgi:hypothetical protein